MFEERARTAGTAAAGCAAEAERELSYLRDRIRCLARSYEAEAGRVGSVAAFRLCRIAAQLRRTLEEDK